MRRWTILCAVATATACSHGPFLVVDVVPAGGAPLPAIAQLKTTLAWQAMRAQLGVPATPRAQPIALPATFSLELPAGASGAAIVSVEGDDRGGKGLAWGSALVTVSGALTRVTVPIGAGGVCPSDVILCDGFETGTFDPALSPATYGPFALTADTVRPHRGSRSAHVHDATGDNGRADLAETKSFAPPNASTFYRSYLWLTALPTNDDLRLEGTPDHVNLYLESGQLVLHDYAQGIATMSYPTTTIPLQQWICVELEIDTAPPARRVWLNDVELTEMRQTAPSAGLPIDNEFDWSIADYNIPAVAQPFDVFIDDVIVDNKPIGCAR
jgi:hypothetical protein